MKPLARSRQRSMLALVGALGLVAAAGCTRARDQYPRDIADKLDAVYASLQRFQRNPAQTREAPGSVSMAGGSAAVMMGEPVAAEVAASTKAFLETCQILSYVSAQDIRTCPDFEAWADRTVPGLQAKAAACQAIVQEIKREYRKDPNAVKFMGWFTVNGIPLGVGRMSSMVKLTDEHGLVFRLGVASDQAVPVEEILRLDFRRQLDNIRKSN